MALALGEDRDQHIGASDLLTARRLDVDHRALNHALESGGRLGIVGAVSDQIFQFRFQIGTEAAPQLVEIDITGPHHRGSILIIDQREQQMFERRVFMVALIGQRQSAMQGLFEAARKSRHSVSSLLSSVKSAPLAPSVCRLFLLHDALQRMLVFAGKVHHLRHFGFGDLIGIHAAFADPVVVHMEHDAVGRLVVLAEKPLDHMHDEFHRRVIVVEDQHAVKIRPLDLRPRLGNDRGSRRTRIAIAAALVVVRHHRSAPRVTLGRGHPAKRIMAGGRLFCCRPALPSHRFRSSSRTLDPAFRRAGLKQFQPRQLPLAIIKAPCFYFQTAGPQVPEPSDSHQFNARKPPGARRDRLFHNDAAGSWTGSREDGIGTSLAIPRGTRMVNAA